MIEKMRSSLVGVSSLPVQTAAWQSEADLTARSSTRCSSSLLCCWFVCTAGPSPAGWAPSRQAMTCHLNMMQLQQSKSRQSWSKRVQWKHWALSFSTMILRFPRPAATLDFINHILGCFPKVEVCHCRQKNPDDDNCQNGQMLAHLHYFMIANKAFQTFRICTPVVLVKASKLETKKAQK